jgi:hypothetical protein
VKLFRKKLDPSKKKASGILTADAQQTPFRVGTPSRSLSVLRSIAHQKEWTRWAMALAPTVNADFLLRSKTNQVS